MKDEIIECVCRSINYITIKGVPIRIKGEGSYIATVKFCNTCGRALEIKSKIKS